MYSMFGSTYFRENNFLIQNTYNFYIVVLYSKGYRRWCIILEIVGFSLCPSSDNLKSRENNVSETGSVSDLRWGGTFTLLGPSERAKFIHWTLWVIFLFCRNHDNWTFYFGVHHYNILNFNYINILKVIGSISFRVFWFKYLIIAGQISVLVEWIFFNAACR
jgi:hypothetical protein